MITGITLEAIENDVISDTSHTNLTTEVFPFIDLSLKLILGTGQPGQKANGVPSKRRVKGGIQ